MCSSTHFRLPATSNFFILPLIPLITEQPAIPTAVSNPFIQSVTIHKDRADAAADGSVESPSESQDW